MGVSRDSVHKRRATSGRHIAIRKKRKFQLGRPPAMTKLGQKKVTLVRVRGGHYKHRALRLDTGNFSWGSEAIAKKARIVSVLYNASNNELVRTNTLVKNAIIQIDATPFRQFYLSHYGIDLSKGEEHKVGALPAKAVAGAAKAGAAKAGAAKAGAAKAVAASEGAAAGSASAPAKAAAPSKGKEKKPGKKEAKSAKKEAKGAKKEAPVAEGAADAAVSASAAPAAAAKDAKAGSAEPKKQSKSILRKVAKRNKGRVLDSAITEQFKVGRLYAAISSRPGQSGRADGYVLEGEELRFYLKKIQKKKGK